MHFYFEDEIKDQPKLLTSVSLGSLAAVTQELFENTSNNFKTGLSFLNRRKSIQALICTINKES